MNRISLINQAGALRSYFPDSKITRRGEEELIWEGEVQPSPLSQKYRLKLHYKRGHFIKIFVIRQKLKMAEGQDKLPHVYSTELQQLCLFFPGNNEWHPGMFYVRSIIPWASEWLYHYEIWVGSGEWHGGGIEHDTEEEKEKIVNN